MPTLVRMVRTGNAVLAIGHGGTIKRTDNGGVSWTAVAVGLVDQDLRAGTADGSGLVVVVGKGGTILRSLDHGVSWILSASNVTADLLDASITPARILATGTAGTVLASTDRGRTWAPATSVGIDSKRQVRRILYSVGRGLFAVGEAGVLAGTLDGGERWFGMPDAREDIVDAIWSGEENSLIGLNTAGALLKTVQLKWVAIDAVPNLRLRGLHASPSGNLFAVGDGAVLRSLDKGATWKWVNERLAGAALLAAASDLSGSVVVVGRYGAVIRSTDGGATWSRATTETRNDLVAVLALDAGRYIAVGHGGVILRTEDSGATWTKVSDSLAPAELESLAISGTGEVVAVGSPETIVHSADIGKSWKSVLKMPFPVSKVVVAPGGGFVAAGPVATLLQSGDGVTWAQAQTDEAARNASYKELIRGPNDSLIALGQGSISRSTDGGRSWLGKPGALRIEDSVFAAVADQSGTVVAVGGKGAIYRSKDEGVNWTAAPSRVTQRDLLAAVATRKRSFIAVGQGGAIVRSTDSGETWTLIESNVTKDLNAIVSESNETLVAVGSGGAIVRSVDDGNSWTRTGVEVSTQDLFALTSTADAGLFAVGEAGVIVRSVDHGASWSRFPSNGSFATLWAVSKLPRGSVMAVGERGVIMKGSDPGTAAPAIRRVVQSSNAAGLTVLRVNFEDPAKSCDTAKCMTLELRGTPDDSNGQKSVAIAVRIAPGASTIEIPIDTSLIGAEDLDTVYARLRLSVPGYTRSFPSASEYFKIENRAQPIYGQAWFVSVSGVFVLLLSLGAILQFRPLWLLLAVSKPAVLDAASKGVGDLLMGLLRAVLLPVLVRHPRVLDAWTEKHIAAMRAAFEANAASSVGRIPDFWPLPIDGPNAERMEPSPLTLGRIFAGGRTNIQIIGQGGAGKTRLALQISRWVFEGELTSRPACILFVDEEFEDLLLVVQNKLRSTLAEEMPPMDFVQALLSKGRLGILVDRLSEKRASTQMAMKGVYRNMSPKILICTGRIPSSIGAVDSAILRPRPLDSSTLLSFLGDQLRAANAGSMFAGLANQSELARRLATQITLNGRELPVTPLLVTIFVSQAIAHVVEKGVIDDLPANIPEAYFTYIDQLCSGSNQAGGVVEELSHFRAAAIVIAAVELGEDLRPKPVPRSAIDAPLKADVRLASFGIDYPARLEQCGLLTRRRVGSEDHFEFVLDPMAECLAAFHHAKACGDDIILWDALIARVHRTRGADSDFMMALRMNYSAYRSSLKFPFSLQFEPD